MKKKYVLALSTGVFIGLAFVSARLLLGSRSLEEEAERLIGCVSAGDAQCVDGYLTEEERRAVKLDTKKLQTLLSQYVVPAYRSHRADPVKVDVFTNGSALAFQNISLGDKGTAGLNVRVAETDEGVRSPTLLADLLLSVALIKYYDSREAPRSLAKIQSWQDMANKDGAYLESIGIAGFVTGDPPLFESWKQYSNRCQERIDKLKTVVSASR